MLKGPLATATLCITLTTLMSAGCSTSKTSEEEVAMTAVRGQLVGETEGEVIFTKSPSGPGVDMIVTAKGLKGAGIHAAHIHQFPVCRGDFSSAGSHFNPTRDAHGHPEERQHHVGDLGNITADGQGNVTIERSFADLSLDPNSPKYVGNRAFIIHQKADDYSSQPTGGAGARIGCAVLQNTAE